MAFRRMSLKRPINSFKHIIDASGTTDGTTVSTIPLATAGIDRDTTSPSIVPIGAKVSSMFISVFMLGSAGAVSGLADWLIWKNPRGLISAGNSPTPGNVGIQPVRNMVYHEEKGLVATEDGTPMVFKGVIKIPRHMQRVAEDDRWEIKIFTPTGVTAQFCVKAIFKDYK